jgi:putative membrane protein
MTSKLVIFVSGSVLALAACGKHDAANNDMATDTNVAAMPSTEATNTQMAAPMTAQGFANAAAASDKFEIESSKLAAAQGQSSAVKSFADKMISAHTASTAKLKAVAGAQTPAVTPDDTLNPAQQASLDSLKPLHGADFDKAYAAAQVDAHQKTLDALNAYASGGDNAALKNLASGMVPTVTAHLNMAKGLK